MVQDFRRSLMQFSATASMPIAHYSPNGLWGTRFIIGQMERIHWFLGLRQAEVEIQAKEADLLHNQRLQRGTQAKLNSLRQHIKWLNHFLWLGGLIATRAQRVKQEIEDLELDLKRSEPLIRDALFELEICKKEHSRISAAHQDDLLGKGFEEIQAEFTPPAALEATAWMVAAEVWAAQNGLPVTVANAIAHLDTSERSLLLQREVELRHGITIDQAKVNMLQILSGLSPEQQNEVLLMAAQIIEPNKFVVQQQGRRNTLGGAVDGTA
jgi:hypothetical protein